MMKSSIMLPFRRTKSNVDYNEPEHRSTADDNNSSDFSKNPHPTATSKSGLLKTITSKIRRPSLRGHDESDHGFLAPGTRRPLCVTMSSPVRSVVETAPVPPKKPTLPTLRDRRSVHGALTIVSGNNLASTHQILPEGLRQAFAPGAYSINQPSPPVPMSPIPPKIPERSPVSLGLVPSARMSPRISKVPVGPMQSYEVPLPFDDQLSPVSPLARYSLPGRSAGFSRALPSIPPSDLPEDDSPPDEDAPAPPCPSLLYRPVNENYCVTEELYQLAKRGWYWGPITRSEAERHLAGKPDGTFLVRNSLDPRHILSLSFRSLRQSLHVRIKYENCTFSFYPHLNEKCYASVVDLVESAMRHEEVCYSRSRAPDSPNFPIQLLYPVSRFGQVSSLKYLCRFVIRLHLRFDHLEQTPLPPSIRRFIAFPMLNE